MCERQEIEFFLNTLSAEQIKSAAKVFDNAVLPVRVQVRTDIGKSQLDHDHEPQAFKRQTPLGDQTVQNFQWQVRRQATVRFRAAFEPQTSHRTLLAPIVAFTMAGLLFVYTRSSIHAAKRNAVRHRAADGGKYISQ